MNKLLDIDRAGDTIVVWKLGRLGRSLKDLINLITQFQEKDIGFRGLNDAIDTTTAHGRLIFNIFASLPSSIVSWFEKGGRLPWRRTRSGRLGGKPKGLSKAAVNQAQVTKTINDQKDKTSAEIGKLFDISRATVYQYIKEVEKAVRPKIENTQQSKR